RERVADYVDENGRAVTRYIETLPNGLKHPILENDGDAGPLDDTPEYVIQPDHYFAMGDNRDDSLDSRTAPVGQVPAENLVGRAEFIFFSSDGWASWWEFWKWPFAIRYGRLFDSVR